MTTNPLHFSTLSSSTSQMQDNVDFIHSGIVQGLATAIEGNHVVSGCNVTQSAGGTYTRFTVSAGKYRKDHTLIDFTAASSPYIDMVTAPHATSGYAWYGLLVITAVSTVALRVTVGGVTLTGSLTPQIPDYTQGDVIIGIVKVDGSTTNKLTTRPFQFLTYNTDAPIDLWIKESSGGVTDVTDYGSIYVKSDHLLYYKHSAGAETVLGGGAAGTVTSVTAGAGMTQTGTSTINPTLNVIAGTGIDVAADAVSVDVSDFMANGANNYIVTAITADTMNAEANFTFDGSALSCTGASMTYTSASTAEPSMYISNTTNDATAGSLVFTNTRSTSNQADDDLIGNIMFMASDSAAPTLYANIIGSISDVTNNDEGGKITFKVMSGGIAGTAALNDLLSIGGEDTAAGTQGEVVVNEAGVDCDFRVESVTNSAMLKVDALADRVGINSATLLSGLSIGTSLNLDHATYSAASQSLTDASPPLVIGMNAAHGGGATITFVDPSTCEGRLIVYYTVAGSGHPITLNCAANQFSSGATLAPNAVGNMLVLIAIDMGGGAGLWLELVKNF